MAKTPAKTINYRDLVLLSVKQKYPYFFMGITVCLIILVSLVVLFMRAKPTVNQPLQNQQIQNEEQSKIYAVKEGDTLWSIAEETYGSGYNYIDIQSANNLTDVNLIEISQVLILPKVEAKAASKGEITTTLTSTVASTADTYTVKPGDFLWKIALESYGDGYMWPLIAKANNINEPNLIFSGNVLKLPK